MWNELLSRTQSALDRLSEAILSIVPALLTFLVAISAGVFVGLALRGLLALALHTRKRDPHSARAVAHGWMRAAGFRGDPRDLAGAVSFWAAVVVALVVGVNALEPGALKTALEGVVAFLPRLITSAVFVLVGLGVAGFARRSVLVASVNAGFPWARAGARAVSFVVVAFALAVALEHLGVGESMLVAAFSIAAGGLVLALALAFGLGARDIARKFLERRLGAQQEELGVRHV